MRAPGRSCLSIIGISMLLLFVVFLAGRSWVKRKAGEELARGLAFGRTTQAARCVSEVLDRHAQTPSLSAAVGQALFLAGCLETAAGVSAYCTTNRDMTILGQARWAVALCERRGLSDRWCINVLQPLQQACRNPERRRGT
jgi:hypothetical protein